MTREEAIEELERLLMHWDLIDEGIYDLSEHDKDAVEIALTALRPVSREQELEAENKELKERIVNWRKYMAPTQEQVEKVWRGEWITPTIIGGRAYNIPHCSACNGVPCGTDEHTRFCAHCGAPMTDEAVQMVMERLEALYEQKV